MGINKQLEEIYSKYWAGFIENGSTITSVIPTNPLLLKVDEEEFEKSDIKVMIFGQETWGWHEFSTPIEEGMNKYESFFIKENFYKRHKKSAFWKAFKFFKSNLKRHFDDKSVTFVWNNISKIGKNNGKTGVTKEIRELEQNYFNVIKEELEILKPDIVIFLTGNRNKDLKFHFTDITFENIEMQNPKKKKMKYKASTKVISRYLPKKSVKLYHPSFFGGFNYVKQDALRFILEDDI